MLICIELGEKKELDTRVLENRKHSEFIVSGLCLLTGLEAVIFPCVLYKPVSLIRKRVDLLEKHTGN